LTLAGYHGNSGVDGWLRKRKACTGRLREK